MARTQKLKVFRTAIGFHDAYVAATSQKAALQAWGSDADLFARGIAERVEDPALIEEPLAHPGKVIKRVRGTLAEQLAALPPDPPKTRAPVRRRADNADGDGGATRARQRRTSRVRSKVQPARPPESKPRPSRSDLDAAEQALAEAEKQQKGERDDFDRRRRELEREAQAADRRLTAETRKLQDRVDEAKNDYEAAMRMWSDSVE